MRKNCVSMVLHSSGRMPGTTSTGGSRGEVHGFEPADAYARQEISDG